MFGPETPELVHLLPTLPPRPESSHKGDFGRVLLVAGSRGMSGAAILSGLAALRGGAGLVYLAVPEVIQSVVASNNPCYQVAGLSCDEDGRFSKLAEEHLLRLARDKDVLAVGPGLGRSSAVTTLVLSLLEQVQVPLVLDADGLNAVQDHTNCLKGRGSPLILTPHPGEFARLLHCDTATVQSRREELALQFAAEHRLVLVLKGSGTVVTDGRRLYLNTTGNPGLATGGTGDVLTGLIAALVAQKLSPFAAAQLGVYLHGLAGDLACEQVGEVSLIATDLLEYLPEAFRTLRS